MAAGGLVCRSKVLLLIDFNRVISLSYFIGASPCNQVLSALRFYATGSYQLPIANDYTLNVSQPSISRSLAEVTAAINAVLLNEVIKFPTTNEEQAIEKQKFMQLGGFPGTISAIDGTHVAIVAPPKDNLQYLERAYVNRKNFHSINVEIGRWTHRIHGSCRRLHTSRARTTPTTPTTPSTPDLAATTTTTTSTPGVVPSRALSDVAGPPETSDVTVSYFRGLPQVTVPLPSRNERCRFTLRPISNTVGDFLTMLRHEDHGIDRTAINSLDGVRIASSNTIEALMEEDFKLIVNDTVYLVNTPKQEKLSQEELRQLSDVRNLVNQLYEALNVEEHQLQKEREILRELEALNMELQPLEEKCSELEEAATRRTTLLTWAGLGLMSVQFGILARLTWWEYSWDIMEPVTYFVTYGTAMAGYAYFVLTKQEYMLPDVKDRQHLITVHKKARKAGVDLQHYNQLKEDIARLTKDLYRLRDPLQIHLPPHHLQTQPKSTLKTIMEFIRSRKTAAKDA